MGHFLIAEWGGIISQPRDRLHSTKIREIQHNLSSVKRSQQAIPGTSTSSVQFNQTLFEQILMVTVSMTTKRYDLMRWEC